MTDRRVCFDFEIAFSNGGGLQGQDFRLDIDGDDVDDDTLAAAIVRDMRLLMVGEVRILNKRIIEERHKRAVHPEPNGGAGVAGDRLFDLSHPSRDAGAAGDPLRHQGSPAMSGGGADAGHDCPATSIVVPAKHTDAGGWPPLERLAEIPAVLVRVEGTAERAIDWHHFVPADCDRRAVLVHTGWGRHWHSGRYRDGHPRLTGKAARHLRDRGVILAGIDTFIDDIEGRPDGARSVLLAAGIPVVEHLTGLDVLPADGFRISAVPPPGSGAGPSPVRAYARVPDPSGGGGDTRC